MPDLQQRNYTTQEGYQGAGERMPESSRTGSQTPERTTMQVASGGTALESLAGAAAIVLAIISLSTTGSLAFYLMMISIIVVGAGLVVVGSSLAARINDLFYRTAEDRTEEGALGTGIAIEVLGGVAGIILGILALLGFNPVVMASVAVIIFGGTLLLSSGTVTEMNDLRLEQARMGASARQMTRQATIGAAGLQALAGIAAIVLGILSVLNIQPPEMILVGVLCVSCSLLLSGGAISARLMTFLSRSR